METLLKRTEITTLIGKMHISLILQEILKLNLSSKNEEMLTYFFDNESRDLLKAGAQLRLRQKKMSYDLSLIIDKDPCNGLEFEFIRKKIRLDNAERLKKNFIIPNLQLSKEIAKIAPGEIYLQGTVETTRIIFDGRSNNSFIAKIDSNLYGNGQEDYEFKIGALQDKELAESMFYMVCDLNGISPSLNVVPNKYSRMMGNLLKAI